MKSWAVAFALAAVAIGSRAQVMAAVKFDGQATMNTNRGHVSGCGIRFLGTHDHRQDRSGQQATIVDGSISIMSAGAVVKGGQYRAATDSAGTYSSTPIQSEMQWLRAGESQPLDRAQGANVASDDPGFTLFTASIERGADAVIDLLEGAILKVAFQEESRRVAIYSGTVRLANQDKDQFLGCLQTLLSDAKGAIR